jgi:ABC-type transporter Mla MlaB component
MSLGENPRTPVMVSGPVTLYEASEVRDTLRTALDAGQPLAIDLETSGPWDLAGLQLLIATAASAQAAGVSVRFEHVPRVCGELAERCGLRDWLESLTDSFL